jgi:hypothetical protein
MEAISSPRYEDFDITYLGASAKNRWAFLGMGTTRSLVEKGDVSPYLNVEEIDPDWMRHVGMDGKRVEDIKLQRLKDKSGTATPTTGMTTMTTAAAAPGKEVVGEGPGDAVEMTDKI